MAIEVVDGYQYIDSRLRPDATLQTYVAGRIYRDVAPQATATSQTTTTPYIIIAFQGGLDLNTANGIRIWTDTTFQVSVIGPQKQSQLIGQAAKQIDNILKPRVYLGGVTISCHRESPLHLSELVAGEPWDHLGGLWRLQIEPS